MEKEHNYTVKVSWKGNKGTGTSSYTSYGRDHVVAVSGKPDIEASADPAFRGDPSRYNPEEFLLASLSGCHMLWFLHLCADQGIIVTDYTDHPQGIMTERPNGGGQFREVVLHPIVTVAEVHMTSALEALHQKAQGFCFIANSMNFPVTHKAEWKVDPGAG